MRVVLFIFAGIFVPGYITQNARHISACRLTVNRSLSRTGKIDAIDPQGHSRPHAIERERERETEILRRENRGGIP